MDAGYLAMLRFIETVAAGLSDRTDEGIEEAFARLAAQDFSESAYRRPEARMLPACRFLPEAVASTMLFDSTLAAGLAEIEDTLAWRQTSGYSDTAMGAPGFMDAYAHAEIVGPTGAFAGDDFLLGLLLLGPDLHYRDHFHPAPELYWTLTGPSEWRKGDGPFLARRAGETIWHSSGVVHAMKTGPEPLLALYMWTRDVAEPARLTDGGQA
ncbi:MAG: dimethylsulfonioproprionate lyase family protein [Parvibaculaceae bacterium]